MTPLKARPSVKDKDPSLLEVILAEQRALFYTPSLHFNVLALMLQCHIISIDKMTLIYNWT